MWEEILRLAIGNGLWALLSVALLAYLIKDSRKREQKYCSTIETLAKKLDMVEKIEATTAALEKTTETIKTSTDKLLFLHKMPTQPIVPHTLKVVTAKVPKGLKESRPRGGIIPLEKTTAAIEEVEEKSEVVL